MVKCVFRWKAASNKVAFDEVQSRLKHLRFKQLRHSRWRSAVMLYLRKQAPVATGGPQVLSSPLGTDPNMVKELYVVQSSENLQQVHVVYGGDAIAQHIVLEASREMLAFIDSTGLFQMKANLEMEGMTYVHGDFTLKIGQIVINKVAKGLVLELDYAGCKAAGEGSAVLEEMVEMLGGTASYADMKNYIAARAAAARSAASTPAAIAAVVAAATAAGHPPAPGAPPQPPAMFPMPPELGEAWDGSHTAYMYVSFFRCLLQSQAREGVQAPAQPGGAAHAQAALLQAQAHAQQQRAALAAATAGLAHATPHA